MNEDVQKNYLDLLDERFHEAGSVLLRQYWSLTIGEVFPTGSQFAGVTMRELVDLVVKEIAELNRIGLAIIPGIMGVLKMSSTSASSNEERHRCRRW